MFASPIVEERIKVCRANFATSNLINLHGKATIFHLTRKGYSTITTIDQHQ